MSLVPLLDKWHHKSMKNINKANQIFLSNTYFFLQVPAKWKSLWRRMDIISTHTSTNLLLILQNLPLIAKTIKTLNRKRTVEVKMLPVVILGYLFIHLRKYHS